MDTLVIHGLTNDIVKADKLRTHPVISAKTQLGALRDLQTEGKQGGEVKWGVVWSPVLPLNGKGEFENKRVRGVNEVGVQKCSEYGWGVVNHDVFWGRGEYTPKSTFFVRGDIHLSDEDKGGVVSGEKQFARDIGEAVVTFLGGVGESG